MEDVGRVPPNLSPANVEPVSISNLDAWIESLMQCKQLAESDVQRLCDKVRLVPAAALPPFTPPQMTSSAASSISFPPLSPASERLPGEAALSSQPQMIVFSGPAAYADIHAFLS